MRPYYYDSRAIALYVSQALEDGPRGTQAGLARKAGLPNSTVSKWAQRQTCPSPEYWPIIEEFFGWSAGTIAGVGGVAPNQASPLEAAIAQASELTDGERDMLLRLYRVLMERRSLR